MLVTRWSFAIRPKAATFNTLRNSRKWLPAAACTTRPLSNVAPTPTSTLPPFAAHVAAWQQSYTNGTLTPEQLKQYYELGYLLVEDVLSSKELDPVIASIEAQVDALARALHERGQIKELHSDASFERRLGLLEQQFPSLSVILHRAGVLPLSICRLWSNPKLLSIAKQIIGPNIAAHPNWSLRSKSPQQVQAVVPWHQDASYLDPAADQTLQLTAWIPLIDATVENGCMEVLEGGHRRGVVVDHVGCSPGTWYLEMTPDQHKIEQELQVSIAERTKAVPVKKGSILLLNNLIPHRSLPNTSQDTRWSIDLRWQDPALHSGFSAKECLRVSSSADPNYRADWTQWAQQDRHVLVASQAGADEDQTSDEFSTLIFGPWLDRWPITKHTRHTQKWAEIKAKKGR